MFARDGKVIKKVSKMILKVFALCISLSNLPKRKILKREALLPKLTILSLSKLTDVTLITIIAISKLFQESLKYDFPKQSNFKTPSIINININI